MPDIDDGVPPATAYDTDRATTKPILVLNGRYPECGDWVIGQLPCSPSPENYTVDRDLTGPPFTFPKNVIRKDRPKEAIGPGSYEAGPAPLIRKSYNAGVPRACSALE
jgi:hypothetical protein